MYKRADIAANILRPITLLSNLLFSGHQDFPLGPVTEHFEMPLRLNVLNASGVVVPLDEVVPRAIATGTGPSLIRETLALEKLDEAVGLEHL